MNVARRSLVAATALVALTLAACSSSGAGSHSSAPGSNSSSPPLKLALIGPFSGSATASSEGGLPKILDAWAQATNKAGGINGHNVQTVVMDIGSATDGGLTAVKSAITQDHVAAIVDFDTNDATWIPYAAQQSVPVIPGSAGLGSLLSDDVFPVLTSPLALSYALVAEAKTYGTKVAIGYAAEIAGGEEEVTLSKTFGAGLGVNVVVASKLPSSAPDYTAFCQQVKQSGATSYTLAFAAATAKKITDQCYQQGVRIPQVLIGPAVPPSWISDPAFKGDIAVDGVAPFFDTSVAGVAQYRSALQQYEPSITHSSFDTSGGAFAWAAAQMFTAGAKAATGTAPSDIQRGLFTVKNGTLGGLIAPVSYTSGKTTTVDCWFTWQMGSGALETGPSGTKPSCAPAATLAVIEQAVLKQLGK